MTRAENRFAFFGVRLRHRRPETMLSAGVAELVDALDLGSSDESCGGSSPSARTRPGRHRRGVRNITAPALRVRPTPGRLYQKGGRLKPPAGGVENSRPQADDGDHWDVHLPETDVVGLAIWCSAAGFCVGYWVVDTVPVRAAIVCAALIG